jgi:pimeloyl-ACP methyl ester carboxylesterase
VTRSDTFLVVGDDRDRQAFERSRLALFERHGLAASSEKLEDRSGRRTAAIVGGAGDATTLLIHGAISDAGEWALVAPHLDGRIVAVDWPGSGLTPPVDIRPLGIRRFALEWLESVVEAIGAPIRIVGSSAGGYLALLYALARPQNVDRLVQVGSFPGITSATPFIFRLFATPLIGRLMLGRQPKDAEANRKQVYSNLVADAGRLPVDVLEADLAASALPGVARSAHDFCRALVSPLTGVRKAMMLSDDELAELTVPFHVLWGSADNLSTPEAAIERLQSVDAVTTEIVGGAGHLMTLEAPERVADSVNAFFAA